MKKQTVCDQYEITLWLIIKISVEYERMTSDRLKSAAVKY